MGFLIRMGFWFSLVLLLLPFNLGNEDAPSVGPIEAFFAAREAVSDLAGICERKPDVCVTGKAALDTIGTRARESARIAIDLIEDDAAPAPTPAAVPAADAVATGGVSPLLPVDSTLSTGTVPVPSARADNLPQG